MSANQIDVAAAQLDRTLEFFGRVESKASFLFGVNVGVLAILLFNIDPKDVSAWYVTVPLVVTLTLIVFSMTHLLMASYPSLKGGEASLFYFRSIGSRTEQDYARSFKQASDDDLLCDLLGQVWRNSEILKDKYDHVTASFRQTVFAMAPWGWFLIASAIVHGRTINLGS